MTGREIAQALTERLKTELPQAEVRAAYGGQFARRPEQPVVCIDLQREALSDGAASARLGVWLYAPAMETAGDLFAAVCAALRGIACTVRSVVRGETQYDRALQCMVTACTVEVSSNATAENRLALTIGGYDCTADGVTVESETKTLRFGSVGEEKPHTVATGDTVYRLTVDGLAAPEAVFAADGFAVAVSGRMYAPCAWKKIAGNRAVIEAGGAETETREGA